MPHWKGHTLAAVAGLAILSAGSMATAQNTVGAGTATKTTQPEKKEVSRIMVGDKAPALTIGKWIKGEPITGFEKGQTYVVEFWATWCGPCRKSIPHLTELAHQYKGKVDFTGVSVWEHEDSIDKTEVKVAAFVKEQAEKMDYRVGIDEEKGTMATGWMQAAGQGGIPTAFIINGEGTIAWIGHPMQMEEPLAKVVEGKWDIAAEAAKQKKEAELAIAREGMMKTVQEAVAAEDWDAAMKALDDYEASSKDPNVGTIKWGLLTQRKHDYKAATEVARAGLTGFAKDNAMMLNQMSWMMLTEDGFKDIRDLDLATQMALRAVEITEGKDGAILDTLARAYFEKGDLAKAIETQTKAVKASPEDGREELQETLKKYQDAAAKKTN